MLGLSCAYRSKQDGKPLKKLLANDIYNQATAMTVSNAKALDLKETDTKKIKAADLEQQTLGISVRAHVVIVGETLPTFCYVVDAATQVWQRIDTPESCWAKRFSYCENVIELCPWAPVSALVCGLACLPQRWVLPDRFHASGQA